MLADDFGARVKFLRTIRGLTQERLAETAGIATAYLSRIERGLASPSFAVIEAISDGLDASPSSLFLFSGREDTPCEGEQASRQSTRHYISWTGIWLHTPADDTHYWSPALLDILGCNGDTSPGPEPFLAHVHDADRSRAAAAIKAALGGISQNGLQCRVKDGDGRMRRLTIHSDALTDADGRPEQVCLLLQDMTEWHQLMHSVTRSRDQLDAHILRRRTERMQARQRLREEVRHRDQLERCLHISEHILNALNDGVAYADTDLTIRWTNDVHARQHGMKRTDMEGCLVRDLFDADYYAAVFEPLLARVLGGEVERFSTWDHRPPGQRRFYEITLTPVRIDDQVVGVASVSREITELQHAQNALAESEKRYRLLADNAQDIIWSMNADYEYTYASPSLERVLGYTLDEYAALPPERHFTQESLGRMRERMRMRRQAESEAAPDRGAYRMELECIHKDGRHLWMEVAITPLYDDDDSFRGCVGYGRDITERKRVEQRLREDMDKYHALFELEGDAVLLVDNATTAVLEANMAAERLLGYVREELQQTCLTELSCDPEAARLAVAEEAGVQQAEYRRKDGSTVPVEISARHFFWRRRRVHVAALRDISARLELERRRQDVERIVRHELRTPASAALAVSRMLTEDASLSPASRELTAELEKLARRMLDTIDLHTDIHRLESGDYVPPAQAVDLARVCRLAALDVAWITREKGVEVCAPRQAGDGADVFLVGDERLLRSAVANLLKNAVEASPEDGRVEMRLEPDGGVCTLSVRNDGAVAPSMRGTLFEKHATYGKPKGQGLGCYLARLVAEAHGGCIRLAGAEDDETEVRLTLPLLQPTG